jgi:hypothetical protein
MKTIRCALILMLNRKNKKKIKSSAKKYEESLLITNYVNEKNSLCNNFNVELKKQKKIKIFDEKI